MPVSFFLGCGVLGHRTGDAVIAMTAHFLNPAKADLVADPELVYGRASIAHGAGSFMAQGNALGPEQSISPA
jgi:hypothetical protein